jgi:ABC-type enterochelin transport system ATPase subunit
VRREADGSLDRLKGIRRELTRKRMDFLTGVLHDNPYVRIGVVPYGARETAEPELRRLLQREDGRFEKDITALVNGIYENATDAAATEGHLSEIKKKIRGIASGTYRDDLEDQRFATHLSRLRPEAFDRLDLYFPEDSLQVQYSTTADGSDFRSIQEGSPGQKTAALLAFLFSYGEEPIVLDQPEDDLDNHLIYDLIVGQLRRIKQRRQVIVVSHNANIVVNGDAELVVALVARGGETHQECAGCLQERCVRDTICAVMEGGREAFEQRYRRIALEEWPHV